MKFYILDDHEPVQVEDPVIWAKWMGSADRLVKATQIGDTRVSTVFLGLDHDPGLFETMIFESTLFEKDIDTYQARCETWEEALLQHAAAVAAVRASANVD